MQSNLSREDIIMSIGAAIGSAFIGYKGQKKAAKSQEKIGREQISESRLAREAFEEITDPFRLAGLSAAAPILSDLGIEIPQGIIDEIGPQNVEGPQRSSLFDFLQKEGFEDIQESAAAQRRLGAGGTLKDLETYSQGLASQQQAQRFNQLFNLLGLGSNVAVGQGTAGIQTAQNIGQYLGGIGDAQAKGAIGQAQAIQQGISDVTGLIGYATGTPSPVSPPQQSFGAPAWFGPSGWSGTYGI